MADRYLVATGNWNATGSWSATSGGSSGASFPLVGDDVHIDANSAGFTLTVNVTSACRSLDASTAGVGATVTGASVLNVGTSTVGPSNIAVKLGTNVVWTYTGTLTYVGTNATAQEITTASKSMQALTVNGAAGTIKFIDAATYAGNFTLTAGTMNVNGQTVTASNIVVSSTATARVLALGSGGAITLSTANGTVLAASSGVVVTNFSVTGSGTITLSGAGPSLNPNGADLQGTAVTWVMTGTGGVSFGSSGGGGTLYSLTRSSASGTNGTLTLAADMTVTNTFTVTGAADTTRVLVTSSVVGTTRTITAASVSLTNVDFIDITGAGAATWSGTSLGDQLGNSGITFTTSAIQYWVAGGSGTWNNSNNWASSSGGVGGTGRNPLPQDDVVLDANSGVGSITTSAYSRCRDFTSTGASGSLSLNVNVALNVYRNWNGPSASTSNGGVMTFNGRGSHTIRTNGVTLGSPVTINAFGGTYTLQDGLTLLSGTRSFTLTRGTFTANNFDVSASTFSINNSSLTTTLNMGTGTWFCTSATVGQAGWTAVSTSLTLNVGSSTIVFTASGSGAKTFAGGGLTYSGFSWTVGTGDLTVTGANSFSNFTLTGNRQGLFTSAVTQTITSALTLTGTSTAALLTIKGVTGGSAFTFSAGGGVTVNGQYLSLQDNTATGGADFIARESFFGSNVTGWDTRPAAETGTSTENATIVATSSSADTGVGNDGSGINTVVGADTGVGVDNGENITVVVADAGVGVDGSGVLTVASADTGVGVEGSGVVTVIVLQADAGVGNDGGISAVAAVADVDMNNSVSEVAIRRVAGDLSFVSVQVRQPRNICLLNRLYSHNHCAVITERDFANV